MDNLVVGKEEKILSDTYMTFDERKKDLEEIDKKDKEQEERKKRSTYSNWYQFNREHSKTMIKLATKYPKAQVVLLFLLEHMDEYNSLMCSYQVFQDALDISPATITRSIKTLKDFGFIMVMKSGSSNIYIVNDELAWSSWSNNKKYCKFPTNVILSFEENKNYLIDKSKIKQISINDK